MNRSMVAAPTDQSASAGCGSGRHVRSETVLLLTDFFWPARWTGGPVRTLINTVKQLESEVKFLVLTRNRDEGPNEDMERLPQGRWVRFGATRVMYLAETLSGSLRIVRICCQADHASVYINSIFSRRFSMIPLLLRRLRLSRPRRVVVAPRGEFGEAALRIKPLRKRFYLAAARWLRLFDGIDFQVTSEGERADLARVLGRGRYCAHLIPDIPTVPDVQVRLPDGTARDTLRMTFLGRIVPIKGLAFAIDVLASVRSSVEFDIFGPIGDDRYWQECLGATKRLPPNIRVAYRGPVDPEAVFDLYQRYDLFFCPTYGENYGHAIFEALVSGLPVLISDRTPWNDVATAGAGWAIPHDEASRFAEVIEAVAGMDEAKRLTARNAARAFALKSAVDAGAGGAILRLLAA